MKVIKLALLPVLGMFANMVSLFAQTVEIVGIYPLNPSGENQEPQMPTVIDEMVDEKILVENENNLYFVNTSLLNEYWERNNENWEQNAYPFMTIDEDGNIIYKEPLPTTPVDKLKFLVGQDTDARFIDIVNITPITQDGSRGRDK